MFYHLHLPFMHDIRVIIVKMEFMVNTYTFLGINVY